MDDATGVWLDDGDGCIEDLEVAAICVVRGAAAAVCPEESDICTKDFGVAVICVVGGVEIPYPPDGVDVALTPEVALTLVVVLVAIVTKPERSVPNADKSKLGRIASRADTSSASSETETGSTYIGPE